MTIEVCSIERLIPYARNARFHSEAQVAQIAASISAFGFNNPVLIDPEDGIIAGHGRILAGLKLGLTQVPVIVLAHLNENQKRAFMLADNKLALNATWDEENLQRELQALAAQDIDLALTGFDRAELDRLAETLRDTPVVDPDQAPEPAERVVTVSGDVWRLGDHSVLCADSTQEASISRILEQRPCQLVFTDLPYNVDYTGKTRSRLKLMNDDLGAEFGAFLEQACQAMMAWCLGAFYIFMASGELHRLQAAFVGAGGHYSTYIIWAKNNFTLGRSDYQRQYEPMLYGWAQGKQHHWCGDRNQGDVWYFDKPRVNDLHPTMKPVALIERAIQNSSRKQDVVLDPFAGSGSTVIACQNTGRRACAIEMDPRYVDVIVRRWEQYTGRSAHRESDGCGFAEAAAGGAGRQQEGAGHGSRTTV